MGMSLNPGPFTVKEHVLIATMGSVGFGVCVCYRCDRGSASVLSPELQLYLSMAYRHEHAAHRLLGQRHCSAVPCLASVHECVDSCFRCATNLICWMQSGHLFWSRARCSTRFTRKSTQAWATAVAFLEDGSLSMALSLLSRGSSSPGICSPPSRHFLGLLACAG